MARAVELLAAAAVTGTFFLAPCVALAQERPPSPVGMIVVEPRAISITSELPGRISATRTAKVRPRVGGIVESRLFEQGSEVEKGDVLFRLDKATYEIAVEAAAASVARAEAVLADARQTERRYTSLRERNVASAAEYESAEAARLEAKAGLAEARARLRAAEVDLGYTDIRAPISGRTGRTQVTEGALVTAQGDVLTTIQQLDVVYADMQQPVSELLRLRRALSAGELSEVALGAAEIRLYLDDGSLYPHPGKLLFAEASVERSSGQVTLRAEIPNPDDTLLPGMYVRVSVQQAEQQDALVIPKQALRRGPAGETRVFVVDDEATAQPRPVTPGRSLGNRMTIEDGLAPGAAVIADGFQKIGPGAPVAPVCWTDPAVPDATPSDACAKRVEALAPDQTN